MTAAPTHVVDRDGNVWAVVRDGGMVTRANHSGPISAGIAWLESEAGPLLPFDPIAYRRMTTAPTGTDPRRDAAAVVARIEALCDGFDRQPLADIKLGEVLDALEEVRPAPHPRAAWVRADYRIRPTP